MTGFCRLGALVEALSGGARGDGVLPMRGATVFVRGRTQCRRGRHWIGFINPVFAHRLKMVLAPNSVSFLRVLLPQLVFEGFRVRNVLRCWLLICFDGEFAQVSVM